MTATPFCLLPVKSLNNIIIGDGKFGKISKKLIESGVKTLVLIL